MAELAIPPLELAGRIGGEYGDYRSIGAEQRLFIEAMLPAGWSYEGKTVLDFGCGTGRTLSAFAAEAARATFVGCDTHPESIAWASTALSPPFEFFRCEEEPPLPQPSGRFDLIYALSVFTHITGAWSRWLADLHRVMKPGGLAVMTVLGPAMAPQILGRGWDDRIGMAVVDAHQDWSIGGPSVLLGEWWVREHWGRAFEILEFRRSHSTTGSPHDLLLMRRREVQITPEEIAARDPADPREQPALECNLELLLDQQAELGAQLRTLQRRLAELEHEHQGLAEKLSLVEAGEQRSVRASPHPVLRAAQARAGALRRRLGQ